MLLLKVRWLPFYHTVEVSSRRTDRLTQMFVADADVPAIRATRLYAIRSDRPTKVSADTRGDAIEIADNHCYCTQSD